MFYQMKLDTWNVKESTEIISNRSFQKQPSCLQRGAECNKVSSPVCYQLGHLLKPNKISREIDTEPQSALPQEPASISCKGPASSYFMFDQPHTIFINVLICSFSFNINFCVSFLLQENIHKIKFAILITFKFANHVTGFSCHKIFCTFSVLCNHHDYLLLKLLSFPTKVCAHEAVAPHFSSLPGFLSVLFLYEFASFVYFM